MTAAVETQQLLLHRPNFPEKPGSARNKLYLYKVKDNVKGRAKARDTARVIPFFNRTPHTEEKIRGVSNQAKNGYGSKNSSGVLTKFILNP